MMKMYANESKGQAFPPMHSRGGDLCDQPVGAGAFPVDTMFQGDTVYPEYLTDINILLCPSDSNPDALDGWYFNDDPTTGRVSSCDINAHSYNYWGWTMRDDLFFADPVVGPTLTTVTLTDLNLTNQDVFNFLIWAQSSPKTDLTKYDQDFGAIRRLREGIERFYITDINNPGASAQAQSELYIMWDDVSAANPDMMNHVPGGCNVLYMDGHVEFLRFNPMQTEPNTGNAFPVNGGGLAIHEATHGGEHHH